ncbi:MAG: polynucleotide adenylyltransferase PcnB [Verrucomicrobia bacterium]|nr:polynucleotide adenylyltransferase PcnB [Verrucomicrobiota bacterium]
MEPVTIDRSQHVVSRKGISPEALRVLYRLKDAGYLAYLAGGGVRDLLLGRAPKDFDVATDAHPNQLKRLFRNCRLVGRRFRLAHVFFHNTIIEVSTFRAHVPADQAPPGPHRVSTPDGMIVRDNIFGTPPEDALRRDFTVNALFYNIADFSIVDYVGGLKDLDARLLRVIGDPRVRFQEDPVRMLRVVRFAASLDFAIEESARQALLEMKELLALSSRERLHEEMLKIFFCGRSEAVLEELFRTGLFGTLFPDIAAWLEGPEGAAGRAWMAKALRQVDKWKAAGLRPGEPLLWALLFGAYFEAQAAHLQEDQPGLPLPAAQARSAHDHLLNPSHRVQIPRNAARGAAEILAAQSAFARTQGKAPRRFVTRHVFRDALVYFKFAARLHGRDEALVEWWMRFLAETRNAGPAKPQGEAEDPAAEEASGSNII